MAPTDKSQTKDSQDQSSQKNDLPDPIKPKEPKNKNEEVKTEVPNIQTQPTQTGVINIKEDPTKGLIRIFRFKLLVTSCQKNTAFKEGEIDLKNVEHVHWFRTHDSRTGVAHVRATLTCGHSHLIEIAYKMGDEMETIVEKTTDSKTGIVIEKKIKQKTGRKIIVGIDMDKCIVGPAIREVSIGALNSPKRTKRWLAVLLGIEEDTNEDLELVEVKVYDKHKHVLEYIDYEDRDLQNRAKN